MKIGILSQWFAPETGPASIPGVLARGLVQRGHEVRVLTGFPNYPTGQIYEGFRVRPRQSSLLDGVGIRRVALFPDHSHRASGRLVNYASFAASAATVGLSALKGVDVIWVYNSPATIAVPMWLAQLRYRPPVVLHNMDMWPDSLLSTGFAPRRGGALILGGLERWVAAMYRTSTYVAVLTAAAGDELVRRGVPPERVKLAPTWIDEATFFPIDGASKRRELGLATNDVVIGYAGALGKAQGVSTLARVVVTLPQELRLRLLVLGSGTEETEIDRIARDSKGRVLFLGHIAHDRVGRYVAAFDYGYVGLASTGDNAWAAPSKIPSLMACAKPILGCLVGESAELVRISGAGRVVTPEDSDALAVTLAEIAGEGREEASRMGGIARDYYATELSSEARIDGVEALLTSAAGRLDRDRPRISTRLSP